MNISTVNSGELVRCEKIKYLGIDLAAAKSLNVHTIALNASFIGPSMQFLGKLGVLPQRRL